ncbi:hypothetical protein T8A63_07250 [Sulfitobacter sp. OXR-159]|uniref:portal protein n=1 Tax=Sulfitobacter sp. OXR-159 TaxID=3100174 RepID=UPI002AC983C5|nr:hypothetical protein [Sulfitobacter sp. OXR-159]WPZ30751.1 hypothetical protein T8A63_06740 [Sulfitobacter sp. OXR-159]WPZ30852.1 hypothetical protein T8A63_07250 [Sulfitobacter sp. OXR-159]
MFNPDEKRNRPSGDDVSGSLVYHGGRKKAPGDTFLPDDTPDPNRNLKRKTAWLDSPQGWNLHTNLMGHYIRELDRQAENRVQMAMDEDFYDHIQFTEDELEILAERGQAPLVFNMIHTSVNWVLGSQRRSTMDYRILARNERGVQAAERKTQLLKHVSDASHFESATADAFQSAVKAGVGWLEACQGSDDDHAKVIMRSENWRSMLYDSTAVRYDLEDARYQMRVKWLDVDIAMGLWRHRAGMIERAANESGSGMFMSDDLGDDAMDFQEIEHFHSYAGGNRQNAVANRDRVRVIECWFKRMVPDAAVMKGGQFHGELFDPYSPGHVAEYNEGRAFLSTRPRQVVHCALLTDSGLLDVRRSPYRHNRFPFTPLWGYRRARDGMPYGMIRGLRDIQRDLNRRAAKSLHHLSTTRVTVEEGAVDDLEELRNEAARPDAVIQYKQGKQAPKIEADRDIAAAHVDMMSRDAQMIQQVSGVTDENLGRKTNATSGKAILARQDQGQLTTSLFFDNLRLSRAIHGEKSLIMVEQYYTEEDEFRITDSRGNPDFVAINNGDPENSIAEFKADFVVSEEDWRATARQAQAEQLLELAGRLSSTAPQMVVGIMDLIVEALDVPKRDELVKRIREVTGQEDPDADPDNPTPEEAERMAAKQAQNELQQRAAMAELSEKEADAAKTKAEAEKASAEAQKILAELQGAGQGGENAAQGAEIERRFMEQQQAFERELMKLREQAMEQTAKYEQKIAEADARADAAYRAVEIEKARIAEEGDIKIAEIEAQAKIAIAQINANHKAETEEAARKQTDDMNNITDRAKRLKDQAGAANQEDA